MFLREQSEAGMLDCDLYEKTSLHKQQLSDYLRQRFRNEYLVQLKLHEKSSKQSRLSLGNVIITDKDGNKHYD